jgi:hypothetical protein
MVMAFFDGRGVFYHNPGCRHGPVSREAAKKKGSRE